MKSEMLLATLPTGETVLGKLAKTTDDKPYHIPIEPLRYGNERAANEKVEKIREEMRKEGKGVGVVKCEGRLMVLVYDLFPSNLSDSSLVYEPTGEIKTSMKVEVETEAGLIPIGQYITASAIYHPSVDAALIGRNVKVTRTPTIEMAPTSNLPKHGTARPHCRPLFATVKGKRSNPRNRHNHGHKGQSDMPHHYRG